MIMLQAVAFFYRSYLERKEGEAAEGKYLDRDVLGDDVAEFRQGHDLHYMYIYIDTYSGVYRCTIRRLTTRQRVCSAVCALR